MIVRGWGEFVFVWLSILFHFSGISAESHNTEGTIQNVFVYREKCTCLIQLPLNICPPLPCSCLEKFKTKYKLILLEDYY